MDLEPLGEFAQARLGRLAARLGDQPDDVRLLLQPPVGVERVDRVELAAGRADRALEVGRLGVEHAVELAAQRPRHLARLDLEQRPGGPDPAQERPDRLAVLRCHDAAAATDPPRHRQAELRQPGGEHRRLVRSDDELEVGSPAGEAQRAARQEPAAKPGRAAVLGGGRPREPDAAGRPLAGPPQTVGQPGDRRLATGRLGPEPVDLGDDVARPRRVDGGQLVAQRRHEVPLGAAHVRRSGWSTGRRAAAAEPTSPSSARDDRARQSSGIVVVGVGRCRRRRRG